MKKLVLFLMLFFAKNLLAVDTVFFTGGDPAPGKGLEVALGFQSVTIYQDGAPKRTLMLKDETVGSDAKDSVQVYEGQRVNDFKVVVTSRGIAGLTVIEVFRSGVAGFSLQARLSLSATRPVPTSVYSDGASEHGKGFEVYVGFEDVTVFQNGTPVRTLALKENAGDGQATSTEKIYEGNLVNDFKVIVRSNGGTAGEAEVLHSGVAGYSTLAKLTKVIQFRASRCTP